MIDEINQSLEAYGAAWQAMVAERQDAAFFESLRPVAVGWKVVDPAQYDRRLAELRGQSDHIVETWMNGRWVAKCILRDAALANGVKIIKLMQRRPGSKDEVGLDHVDYYCPDMNAAEATLKAEAGLEWTWENNDVIANYDWTSIWFGGTEAKLKSSTILDIIVAELQKVNAALLPPQTDM